jgi:hypothetical protein
MNKPTQVAQLPYNKRTTSCIISGCRSGSFLASYQSPSHFPVGIGSVKKTWHSPHAEWSPCSRLHDIKSSVCYDRRGPSVYASRFYDLVNRGSVLLAPLIKERQVALVRSMRPGATPQPDDFRISYHMPSFIASSPLPDNSDGWPCRGETG